jgi:cation:H+ antiporter
MRFLLAATAAVPVILLDGVVTRLEGFVFVVGAAAFTYFCFSWGRDEEPPEEVAELTEEELGTPALSGLFVVGLTALIGGGHLFVTGAAAIAEDLGVTERVVGLTVVAFGTSVPELAASLVAALRGHSELAIGNVVGSNLFNVLLILGATSLTTPIHGDLATMQVDIIVMSLLTVALFVSLRKKRRMTRVEGALYIASYLGFIGWLVASN